MTVDCECCSFFVRYCMMQNKAGKYIRKIINRFLAEYGQMLKIVKICSITTKATAEEKKEVKYYFCY